MGVVSAIPGPVEVEVLKFATTLLFIGFMLCMILMFTTCPRFWLGRDNCGDSDFDYEPPPACQSWEEVGHWMRIIAADPESELAATAGVRFRDHADLVLGPGDDRLLWLVWLEAQLERQPDLIESTGFHPDDEIFRTARQSHGYRGIVSRLREGRPERRDQDRMVTLRRPELLDAALEGLQAGTEPARMRVLIDRLATWDDPRMVPALVGVTEGGPEHRRTYASQSVARLQDPRTVLLLIHKLGAKTRTERFSAYTGLLRITGEEIPRDDRRGWAEHWQLIRDRYPTQLLPAGVEEPAILEQALRSG